MRNLRALLAILMVAAVAFVAGLLVDADFPRISESQ
jgi:hypothetical protein